MQKKILKVLPLAEKHLSELLRVRNSLSNRMCSVKTKKILKKEHQKWFSNINNSKKDFYYIVMFRKKIIGCIYVKKSRSKKIDYLWGFYTKPNIKIDNLGTNLKYILFEIIFDKLKFKKIYCEVKLNYDWIMNWHIRWGHKIVEKKGKKYILQITKNRWLKIKKKLKKNLSQNIKIKLYL